MWEPLKDNEKTEDDKNPQPKRGNGQAGNGEYAHEVVDPGVLLERRQGSQRDREENGHGRGHQGQLEAQLQTDGDLMNDRLTGPHGVAEIEAHDPPHPGYKLVPQGLVQSKLSPFLIEGLFRGKGPGPGVFHLYDVPRGHPEHEKDQNRDPEERRDQQQEPLEDVAVHDPLKAENWFNPFKSFKSLNGLNGLNVSNAPDRFRVHSASQMSPRCMK